jgi:hypothetical protein
MKRRGASTRVLMLAMAVSCVVQLPVAGQSSDSSWAPARTAYDQPDLQGIWTNNTATPMERPESFGDKAELSEEELARLAARLEEMRESSQAGDLLGDFLIQRVLEDPDFRGFDQDTGNYNSFWLVERQLDRRTSLVIDPPNGRIPPFVTEARQRLAAARGGFGGTPRGPEDMPLNVRCITYGVPNILAGYNSYFQILQTPDHVVILQELIHDARVVPLGDRPPLDADIKLWNGDSRGRWEGDSLVIETTNYSTAGSFRGASDQLLVTERFTRVSDDVLEWQITFEDPTTWESPWTMMIPLSRSVEAMFEYACHEGNYGMHGILAGARAEEAAATSGQ